MKTNKKISFFIALFFTILIIIGRSFAFTIDFPDEVTQGGIYKIGVSGEDSIIEVSGTFLNRNVYFDTTKYPGTYFGLLGVDLSADPGPKSLHVIIKKADGTSEAISREVMVRMGDFRVQHLTLPDKWVHYDEETIKRINDENRIITALFKEETKEKLWTQPFLMPLEGRITGEFGLRRYINGEPRSSHSGLDISAVTGTPIVSANTGKTALVMDMFFSGLSLFIDHGQGLYTMYFHLSEVLVEEGDEVERGQTIALVGATGRVTGAHLHFGVRLNYNKVSPWDLVNLKVH